MLRVLVILALLIAPAHAQTLRTLGAGSVSKAAVATYTGPGDVVGGAIGWWGLRGYSGAYAAPGNNPAADLCDVATGLTCVTVNILSNGKFDVATASGSSACSVACSVSKLYDQTGNGNHLLQATAANRPTLTFNAIGSLPAMRFISANTTKLGPATQTQAQPFTISLVYNNNNDTGAQAAMWAGDGNTEFGVHRASANDVFIFAGSNVPTATANANTWHAVQGVFNNASSDIFVDGSSNPGTLASSTGFGGGTQLGLLGGDTYNGLMGEAGAWGSAFNGTQETNMNSNQHTFWGF